MARQILQTCPHDWIAGQVDFRGRLKSFILGKDVENFTALDVIATVHFDGTWLVLPISLSATSDCLSLGMGLVYGEILIRGDMK